jgi:hypothetical protein
MLAPSDSVISSNFDDEVQEGRLAICALYIDQLEECVKLEGVRIPAVCTGVHPVTGLQDGIQDLVEQPAAPQLFTRCL